MEESTARVFVDGVDERPHHPPLRVHTQAYVTGAGDTAFSPGIAVSAPHEATAYERHVKPVIDCVLAAILLVALSPLMLAIAVAVRVTMGPSVIFRQKRIGFGGRVIEVLKFRTMAHDRRRAAADVFDGQDRRVTHKSRENPLVTPLGRVLRKLSLDELPQLWNVLRGEMSLVGPRPQLVHLVDQYEPWALQRHQVKPGLTGLWQVTARREVPMEECVDIDLDYVDSVSFLVDLKILLLTIPVLLWKPSGY